MAVATSVDQAVALTKMFTGGLSFGMPERRPPDPMTAAHAMAAENVHKAAAWLLRGSDLAVVVEQTPYLAEDVKDLRSFYEGLPLERRFDILIGLEVAWELLRSSRLAPREQYPRFRRAIDLYFCAVGIASLAPRQVFLTLHRGFWFLASRRALSQYREPITPLPFSAENRARFAETVEAAVAVFAGPSSDRGSAGASGSRGGLFGGGAGLLVFFGAVTAVGVGAAVVLGEDGRLRTFAYARHWWERLLEACRARRLTAMPPMAPHHQPSAPSYDATVTWPPPQV